MYQVFQSLNSIGTILVNDFRLNINKMSITVTIKIRVHAQYGRNGNNRGAEKEATIRALIAKLFRKPSTKLFICEGTI